MYKVKAGLYDRVFEQKKEDAGMSSASGSMQASMLDEVQKNQADYKELSAMERNRTKFFQEKYMEQFTIAETQKKLLEDLDRRVKDVVRALNHPPPNPLALNPHARDGSMIVLYCRWPRRT